MFASSIGGLRASLWRFFEQLLLRLPTLHDLREQAAELQRKNAELTRELKRLLVFDRAPGRLLSRILAERVGLLHRDAPPEAIARERAFAEKVPIYRALTDRFLHKDPPASRSVEAFGLTISVPDDACTPGSLSARILSGRWLPFDDVARVRRVVVGGTMLDIGANIGTTAIPRLVLGDFSVVYAAEPHPRNYECLVANAMRNGLAGRLLPDRVAISSWDGAGRLHESPQIGGHHLVPAGRGHAEDADVPCLTLDRWVTRLGVAPADITFVKIDVQGWDAEVLIGAPMLRAHRHIVWQIELAPRQMKRARTDIKRFCRLAQATFTHMQQLGAGAETARPVAELPRLLANVEAGGGYTNVLLYNQAADAARLSA